MHKINFLVVLIIICCTQTVFAQKLELGKVSVAELEEKSDRLNPSAAATILYTKGKSKFVYHEKKGFSIVHECEMRIKIYKTDGLSWANFSVPYFVGYKQLNDEMVSFSNAVTYNLENGQIVKTKLSGEGRFKESLNELWKEASITMPNVRAGSVIEFKYTLASDDITEFPKFHFQYGIPVRSAEYQSEIPEYLIYKPVITGFGNIISDSKIANGHQNFANEHNQTVNLSYRQVNSNHKTQNVPALREEPFTDNLNNYRQTIFHELEMTRFPDAPERKYLMTWDDVAKTIYKHKSFGEELAQRQYFESDLAVILKDATTDREKIEQVFQFVKTSMAWDGHYGYNTRNGVKKAYQDRTGNIAEINFILISMLNRAGITANPVLLSTVDHGIPVYPNFSVFNYVIAAVNDGEKQLLLDATDKAGGVNLLPFRDLNWTGRLVRRDGTSQEVDLVPKTQSLQTVNMMGVISEKGSVTGKIRNTYTDYLALRQKEDIGSKGKDAYIEGIERRGDVQISEYSIDNLKQEGKPVVENFNFVAQQESIDGKLYIDPLLFLTVTKNPFVLESRSLPIYFGYPTRTKYLVNLELPSGYTVESLPKPINISTGENVGQFNFQLQQTGNKIQLTASSEMNLALVSAQFYEALKTYYQKMTEKQNEKIVLKKN